MQNYVNIINKKYTLADRVVFKTVLEKNIMFNIL